MPKQCTRRDLSYSHNKHSSGGVQDVFVLCLKTQNREKLLQLLQTGHNPNLLIRCFDVRLLLSSETEKMRRLEPYLDRGLLPNVTVLHLAVLVNDCDAINILLNFGAKVNEFCGSGDKDLSVLMLAIVMGHSELLDMLIRRGANYSLWNRDFRTPLDLSILCNNVQAVRCLAQHKRFYYNKSQKSRLTVCEYVHRYALPDRLEIVGRMVEIGYDMGHCADGSVLTLVLDLMQVPHKHTLRVFELLLAHSPDLLYVKKKPSNESLLHLATKHSAWSLVQLFLDRGLPVAGTDVSGNSALHCLPYDNLTMDGIEILKELLKRDADVFHKNDGGVSAFEMAVKVRNPRLASIFAEHFTKPSNGPTNRLIIHEYLSNSGNSVDPHVLKSFLSYGLAFDAKNEERQTTVHCLLSCCDSGCDSLAKCLTILTQGEELLDAADSSGMTPIMLAVKRNMPMNAIMKLIPANSIDSVSRDGQDIVSLLITRYKANDKDRMALLKLVIDKGVNVNNKKRFGCKALLSAAKQFHLKPLAEPLLLLRSGYMPLREDIEDAVEWDLQLFDHILRHSSSAVMRNQFPNILLSVIANFLPQNPPLDLLLKVVKKLTDEFHIDVNYFEKKTSAWHLLIGSAHRYQILPVIDHLLTISNANLNLGSDWHEVGIPLTYALILGEYKIAERLIHKMTMFDHVCIKRMKLKFGFSGLLVSLCKRGFRMPASFFERGFGQDMEIVRELDWFRKHLTCSVSGNPHAGFEKTGIALDEREQVSSSYPCENTPDRHEAGSKRGFKSLFTQNSSPNKKLRKGSTRE